jgi:hypothetical protein
MKKTALFLISLITVAITSAQINLKDSTVQTVGYWDKKEKQIYSIVTDKFKVKGKDTISKARLTYDVEITVIDSTDKSYTLQWAYSNCKSTSTDKIRKKIDAAPQGLKILVKTDELGAFEEVLNWQQVRDHILRTSSLLRTEFGNDKDFDMVMKELEKIYSTKENIEAIAINDIQQFYMFHGGKYTKGEPAEGTIQIPNVLSSKPFDAEVLIYLDEINKDDDNYVLRYEQTVDEKQLIVAATEYVTALAKKIGKPVPKDLGIKEMIHQTIVGARMHEYGWPIYSILTKTVTSEDIINIEERVIEIKD